MTAADKISKIIEARLSSMDEKELEDYFREKCSDDMHGWDDNEINYAYENEVNNE